MHNELHSFDQLASDHLTSEVFSTIRAAGDLIIAGSMQQTLIEKKGDHNYVTGIDYQVQQFIVDKLMEILPESRIIAEEASRNRFNLDPPTWILDPVDGTTNLIHDLRHSAVSLALFIAGVPEYGFIYNPYLNEMFFSRRGQGAYLNGRRIRVSNTRCLADSLVGFGTNPYDRSEASRTFDIIKAVFMSSREIRRTGSAALDLAYVAAGRLDGFFELELQPWDFAAGGAILAEAGGKLANWRGEPVDPVTPGSIIAANPDIYAELLAIILSNQP